MEMTHTAIPDEELKVFKSLKNIRVVFDIGARDDVDYLLIKPNITLHAFEPNPVFFEELKEAVSKLNVKKVYLNNFGLGDEEGKFPYDDTLQAIKPGGQSTIKVKRLSDYVEEQGIKRIDFLKIDTEGYEWNILRGAGKALGMCRYIQYERNNNDGGITAILKDNNFTLYDIGYSNTVAVRAGEALPWLPEVPPSGALINKEEDRLSRLKKL